MRRFCDDYYRLLEQRITGHPAAPGGAPAPLDERGYGTEEMLFRAMAEAGSFNMRIVTRDDLRWPGWMKSLRRIGRPLAGTGQGGRRRRVKSSTGGGRPAWEGNTFIALYLLSGPDFPWASLGREIRLHSALGLLAQRLFG